MKVAGTVLVIASALLVAGVALLPSVRAVEAPAPQPPASTEEIQRAKSMAQLRMAFPTPVDIYLASNALDLDRPTFTNVTVDPFLIEICGETFIRITQEDKRTVLIRPSRIDLVRSAKQ